jgi:hypothetical protein
MKDENRQSPGPEPVAQAGAASAKDPEPERFVFISYKSEDRPRVERLVAALQARGIATWHDRELVAGTRYRAAIEERIAAASCVLVCWTRKSVVKGDWVHDEADTAAARDALVPVLLDRVRPPHGLRQIHAVDLCSWRGDPDDERMSRLVDALRVKMGLPARPPPLRVPARPLLRAAAPGLFLAAVVALAPTFTPLLVEDCPPARVERWVRVERQLPVAIALSADGHSTEAEARAELDQRAPAAAEAACRAFESAEIYRFRGAVVPDSANARCDDYPGGWRCDAKVVATCQLRTRSIVEVPGCR